MIYLFYILIVIKLIISPLASKFNNIYIFLPDICLIFFCTILILKETSLKINFLFYLILFQILIVITSSVVNDINIINSIYNNCILSKLFIRIKRKSEDVTICSKG